MASWVAELKGIVDAPGFMQKVGRSAQGNLVWPALRAFPTFGSRQSKAVGSRAVLQLGLGLWTLVHTISVIKKE